VARRFGYLLATSCGLATLYLVNIRLDPRRAVR